MDIAGIDKALADMWQKCSVAPTTIYFKGRRFDIDNTEQQKRSALCSPQGLASLFPALKKGRRHG